VVKRHPEETEEALLQQLALVPEISLDRRGVRTDSERVMVLTSKQPRGREQALAILLPERPDLDGLPFRMGDDCRLSLAAANSLRVASVALRAHLTGPGASSPGGSRPAGDLHSDAQRLQEALFSDGRPVSQWDKPEAIPALQQLLTAESAAVRDVLVKVLANIQDSKASVALAQRALFDVHPGVRRLALNALAKRPAEEYRDTLLAGFRHPWLPVIDHAAEALVTLQLRDTTPMLVALLDQPAPDQPAPRPGREGLFVRELVRVNHFRNCVLCHAVSANADDPVRGLVPRLDQPISGGVAYYVGPDGIFVRADTTYLRQDFSAPLEVKNANPWPSVQRFDFVARDRQATYAEVRAQDTAASNHLASEYHKALFFALRGLTGKDAGPSVEDWKRLFFQEGKTVKVLNSLQDVAAVAAHRGEVYASASSSLVAAEQGRASRHLASGTWRGLAHTTSGKLVGCLDRAIVEVDPRTGETKVLADRSGTRKLVAPRHLAADLYGGIYFTDSPREVNGTWTDTGAVYYLSVLGVVTQLPIRQAQPCGVAVAPDCKTLYLQTAAEVHAYPLEAAGLPGTGKLFCRCEGRDRVWSGEVGLAVDSSGNLLVPNPRSCAVEVFNRSGARLRSLPLPEAPVDCAFDSGTLYVAGRTAVSAIEVEAAVVVAAR
jgi:sugar lactone lactonase YvrE